MSTKSDIEHQELEKYYKHLFYKSAQIVVQSRLGEKSATISKPRQTSGSAWFNLTVSDVLEVTQEARSVAAALTGTSGARGPGLFSSPLCAEISLQTTEGDTMILETWRLSMTESAALTSELVPGKAAKSGTLYSHMGLLLKSLVAVTRVTPAYRLSRRQSPETYVVCYRIYAGSPAAGVLGDGHHSHSIGQVNTPYGTISLRVDYRTKMTISSSTSRAAAADRFMVKSNHFFDGGEAAATHARRSPRPGRERVDEPEVIVTSDESQDAGRIFSLSPVVPSMAVGVPSSVAMSCGAAEPASAQTHGRAVAAGGAGGGGDEGASTAVRVGAFVSQSFLATSPGAAAAAARDDDAGDPLLDLIPHEAASITMKRSSPPHEGGARGAGAGATPDTQGDAAAVKEKEPSDSAEEPLKNNAAEKEDFVLVKTPFSCKLSENTSELGIFFKEQQSLQFATGQSDQIHTHSSESLDLNTQLANFETNLEEYDDLIKALEIATSESESETSIEKINTAI